MFKEDSEYTADNEMFHRVSNNDEAKYRPAIKPEEAAYNERCPYAALWQEAYDGDSCVPQSIAPSL